MELVDFEASLSQLETIIKAMEGGQLTLEQSLAQFELGIGLTRNCQKILDQAELKVQILMSQDGQTRKEDFDLDIS